MNRWLVSVTGVLAATLVIAGCGQTAAPTAVSAGTPTSVAAPATAGSAAATSAPAATPAAPQPKATAAPTKGYDFTKSGRPITMVIPWAAGGSSDVGGRLLAAGMEKELGTPVQIVNKPGASGQVGMTEVAKAKPDGLTIAYSALSGVIINYMDPQRTPTFLRKDLTPIAAHVADVRAIAVNADGPYRSVKDLVDAAKANPGKVPVGSLGVLSDAHLAILWLQKLAGVEFAIVQFTGGGEAITQLSGGHVEAYFGSSSELPPLVKSGKARVIGLMGKEESKFLPGVKTLEAQGYPIQYTTLRALYAPAGTPKEAVDTLSAAVKKVMESQEHIDKLEGQMGLPLQYMNPQQMDSQWTELESRMKELITLAR